MKKVIAVYNAPQEYGCPFITFIDCGTGCVIDTVCLDFEGYCDAGTERIVRYEKTGNEKVCGFESTKLPEVGEVVSVRLRKMWVIDEVNLIREDNNIIHTFVGETHQIEVVEKVEWRYLDRNKDEYILKMSALGFDMTGWCLYKRRKTNYKDFLTTVVKTYNKNWEVLNLIVI